MSRVGIIGLLKCTLTRVHFMIWVVKTITKPTRKVKAKRPSMSKRGRTSSVVSTSVYPNAGPQRTLSAKSSSPPKGWLIEHRELIDSITSSSTYRCVGYDINPGRSTFPWLSTIAHNFDCYEILSLTFEYIPSCPVITTGQIGLYVDYDIEDRAPMTLLEIGQHQGNCIGSVFSSVTIPLNVPLNYQNYFVANVGSDEDHLKDPGVLWLALEGCADNLTMLGSLYCNYRILLKKPQLQQDDIQGEAGTSADLDQVPKSEFAPGPASGLALLPRDGMVITPSIEGLVSSEGQINFGKCLEGLCKVNIRVPTTPQITAAAATCGTVPLIGCIGQGNGGAAPTIARTTAETSSQVAGGLTQFTDEFRISRSTMQNIGNMLATPYLVSNIIPLVETLGSKIFLDHYKANWSHL